MAKPSTADQASAFLLAPGVSYFQVLTPSAVLGPGGVTQYAMMGPFFDILQANHHASQKPGSLVSVTLVLLEAQPPPAAMRQIVPEKTS